jgi:hypothetical protein
MEDAELVEVAGTVILITVLDRNGSVGKLDGCFFELVEYPVC